LTNRQVEGPGSTVGAGEQGCEQSRPTTRLSNRAKSPGQRIPGRRPKTHEAIGSSPGDGDKDGRRQTVHPAPGSPAKKKDCPNGAVGNPTPASGEDGAADGKALSGRRLREPFAEGKGPPWA